MGHIPTRALGLQLTEELSARNRGNVHPVWRMLWPHRCISMYHQWKSLQLGNLDTNQHPVQYSWEYTAHTLLWFYAFLLWKWSKMHVNWNLSNKNRKTHLFCRMLKPLMTTIDVSLLRYAGGSILALFSYFAHMHVSFIHVRIATYSHLISFPSC